MTALQNPNEPQIDLGEILAAMDELGRAKFDAALERVKNARLQERIAELETQRAADDAQRANNVPPKFPREQARNGRKVETEAEVDKRIREFEGG